MARSRLQQRGGKGRGNSLSVSSCPGTSVKSVITRTPAQRPLGGALLDVAPYHILSSISISGSSSSSYTLINCSPLFPASARLSLSLFPSSKAPCNNITSPLRISCLAIILFFQSIITARASRTNVPLPGHYICSNFSSVPLELIASLGC